MRAVLWIAVLLAAFALAWQIQDRWADRRREERDAAYARPSDPDGRLPEGFSRAIVGQPSGADPITPPVAPAPAPPEPRRQAAPTGDATTMRRHVVQKGDSLSEICAAVYGTARKDVVEAVARANGLASAQSLRVGQQLVLPPLADLKSATR